MAKEYKFMFDRSFDTVDEEDVIVIPQPDNDAKNPMEAILNAVKGILDAEESSPDLAEIFTQKSDMAEMSDETDMLAIAEKEEDIDDFMPPPPTFSEEELTVAKEEAFDAGKTEGITVGKQEGYDTGFAEGFEKGKTDGQEIATRAFYESQQKKDSDTFETVCQKLSDFATTADTAAQNTFTDALKIAQAVCERILPVFCAKHGTGEISAFLSAAFEPLRDEQKVVIRLHPDTVAALKTKLPEIIAKTGFTGKITVAKDDALSLGDCFIEWKNGGIERKVEDVLQQADLLLKQYEKMAESDVKGE